MAVYQIALVVALIIIGAGLFCGTLLSRRLSDTELAEPDYAGHPPEFVNSLPSIHEQVKPRRQMHRTAIRFRVGA
jgi:hypothetical protein